MFFGLWGTWSFLFQVPSECFSSQLRDSLSMQNHNLVRGCFTAPLIGNGFLTSMQSITFFRYSFKLSTFPLESDGNGSLELSAIIILMAAQPKFSDRLT